MVGFYFFEQGGDDMLIKVNGKETMLDKAMSISEFLEAKSLDPASVVIEYNYEILKNDKWADITLKNNDNLEILRFVGGG